MKNNRTLLLILAALILLTGIVAAVHLTTRAAAPEGTLLVQQGSGEDQTLAIEDLPLGPVQGTVVNGKGEERTIDDQGILLSDALKRAGIGAPDGVTVTGDDEYSAQVTGEEIAEPDRVYLVRQENGRLQLIVFGDSNSKRNVSDVARLTVP